MTQAFRPLRAVFLLFMLLIVELGGVHACFAADEHDSSISQLFNWYVLGKMPPIAKELADERAAARREGIPLNAVDLQRPIPPPGKNAADVYRELARVLKNRPLILSGSPNPFRDTPEQAAQLSQLLTERRDVLDLIHKAADMPLCVFPRQWSQGMKLQFPEFDTMREAAHLITAETYCLVCEGRYEQAITNQARGFQLARHAASDPTVFGYLAALGCQSTTLQGMKGILYSVGPNLKADQKISLSISANPAFFSLRYALRGEVVVMEYELQRLRRVGPDNLSSELKRIERDRHGSGDREEEIPKVTRADYLRVFRQVMDATEAEYLRRMRRIHAVADEHTPDAKAVLATNTTFTVNNLDTPLQSLPKKTLSDFIPVYQRVYGKGDAIQSLEMLALASAGILAEKARTGKFPDHVPGVGTDPINNKPYGYRVEGLNGFVLYSTGTAETFDGGKPGARYPKENYFRYPAVQVIGTSH